MSVDGVDIEDMVSVEVLLTDTTVLSRDLIFRDSGYSIVYHNTDI